MEPLYPDIHVQLTGEDGNAFFIIGRCRKAMRKAGLENKEIEEFCREAMESDYDHVLQTVMKWFDWS